MRVVGYTKLVSKKGLHMVKMQCVREFTDADVSRVEEVGGSCIEDIWLYEPVMNKVTPQCIGKDIELDACYIGGRMSVSDVHFK